MVAHTGPVRRCTARLLLLAAGGRAGHLGEYPEWDGHGGGDPGPRMARGWLRTSDRGWYTLVRHCCDAYWVDPASRVRPQAVRRAGLVDARSNGELSRGAFVTDFRAERHRRGCGGSGASRVGVGPPGAGDRQPDGAGSRHGGGDRGAVGSVGCQAGGEGLRLWPSVLRAGPAVDCRHRVSRGFGAGPVRADPAGSAGRGRFRGVALGPATHRGRPGGMPPDWWCCWRSARWPWSAAMASVWADDLATQVDAGPSAAFLGAGAAATATVRPPMRGRLRVGLGVYGLLSLVHIGRWPTWSTPTPSLAGCFWARCCWAGDPD